MCQIKQGICHAVNSCEIPQHTFERTAPLAVSSICLPERLVCPVSLSFYINLMVARKKSPVCLVQVLSFSGYWPLIDPYL